jgi:hypothetical protein
VNVVAFYIAVMFVLILLNRGREAEMTRRCMACGARHGERHHRDCQWRE